ncbi:MAG: hypothetical protein JWM98_3291 [Thermoleophilia bacterium]|nr:hypothetical protein [Thermoleophilia bacterium]
MSPDVSTGIVAVQVALIVLALIIGVAARQRKAAIAFAWIGTALAFCAIGLAGASVAGIGGVSGETSRFVVYAVTAFIAAAIGWAVVAVVNVRIRAAQERFYAKPETREAMAADLREVLRTEGIRLDERLSRAEQEREQFLYALEDQHARQIRGLADEYQHEAATILRSLMDQLQAERLEPMVEERFAEQQARIERELGAIDATVAGEALMKIREQQVELEAELAAAAKRVESIRDQNPDLDMEEQAKARLATVDAMVAEQLAKVDGAVETQVAATAARVEAATAERAAALEARLAEVDLLLEDKIATAGNPLLAKMAETQGAVEAQLNTWMSVLDARFAETEGILNQRIIEQEGALEGRVVELETALEERLAQHVAAVEQVLTDHDTQLQTALTDQSAAIGSHFSTERDRLIGELTEHGVHIQETVANELMTAEARARETVEATQAAWNVFTDELEQRFAETREEAIRVAHEIAEEERHTLRADLEQITKGASDEIAAQVEGLGREAAWQRAQVERSVVETIDVLKSRASEAVTDADRVFADLERIGAERVERIRRDAEDALVQSRDYVGQLQESLAAHLEGLRERSGVVADEMNDRLAAITSASHEGATQLEQYARDLVDATSRELGTVAERATTDLQNRINQEFTGTVSASLEAQQRTFELHLGEVAQRIMQQVQGDLAGLAEHARGAVTGELDNIIQASRQHAQEAQEQAFRQVMGELARQGSELAEQARAAGGDAQRMLENGMRDNRRQLEEAMTSMGAHMREELVRFHDEGQRRVDAVIAKLRSTEQDVIREEDRKLAAARQELVRQHQGALEQQVRSLVGGLSNSLDLGAPAPTAGGSFTEGLTRPSTPLGGGNGFG